MTNNHYNKKLKTLARTHRSNMPKSEACLWKYILSKRQMMGYQFRRQRPIGNYIADFVCLTLKLIIEVDGFSHDNPEATRKDNERDLKLKKLGFITLRFSAWEVLNSIDDVDILIGEWITKNACTPPPKSRRQ